MRPPRRAAGDLRHDAGCRPRRQGEGRNAAAVPRGGAKRRGQGGTTPARGVENGALRALFAARPAAAIPLKRLFLGTALRNKAVSRYIARASTALSSTFTAGIVWSSSMSSFSLWLMPPRQGVKIIAAGHTFAM